MLVPAASFFWLYYGGFGFVSGVFRGVLVWASVAKPQGGAAELEKCPKKKENLPMWPGGKCCPPFGYLSNMFLWCILGLRLVLVFGGP